MPIYQAYNKRINAWVKYKFGKKGYKTLNVKEREPRNLLKVFLKKEVRRNKNG